jgi:hypothetical protein
MRTIQQSVGHAGSNQPADVRVIQRLLREHGIRVFVHEPNVLLFSNDLPLPGIESPLGLGLSGQLPACLVRTDGFVEEVLDPWDGPDTASPRTAGERVGQEGGRLPAGQAWPGGRWAVSVD